MLLQLTYADLDPLRSLTVRNCQEYPFSLTHDQEPPRFRLPSHNRRDSNARNPHYYIPFHSHSFFAQIVISLLALESNTFALRDLEFSDTVATRLETNELP